ncbi:nucleotidyltransferase domain-containing protein [Candidatus Woesearchaeota archaeon]|nr:nucleotidyltransferase domain-containing protein [Candidatus Woesearchaeota archaeon]
MELIKTAIKVGNSAGVLLPKKYLNSQVKIVLKPLNIEKDVVSILMEEGVLKEVMGVYLVGSYARMEQNIESDIDILVITSNLNKRIVREKYELIYISKKELEEQLDKNALPVLAMIKEAKIIINEELIKKYINSPLTEKNLRWHVDTTKSAMKVIEEDLKISKELKEKYTWDGMAYSLILRLRTLYIIDCVRKNKKYTNKDFLNLIMEITGTLTAYNGYLRVKTDKKNKQELSISETEILLNYINKKVLVLEKWLKEKKD